MAPSPNKCKTFHKGSGKLFRHKDKEKSGCSSTTGNSHSSGSFNSSSASTSTSTSNGIVSSIKKDEVLDLKDCPLTLPDVCPLDHTKSLPRYHALACGEGVSMEELDALQLELELLLSSISVRQTALSRQLEVIEQLEKGRLPPKTVTSAGKRLRVGDADRVPKKTKEVGTKVRDPHPAPVLPSKPPKVKCSVVRNEPLFDVPDLGPPETPRPPPAKNDVTNRFWSTVEQYCQEITAENVKMLEELLSSQNDDAEYMKVPPLGRHYTLRWAQEDLADEQKEGTKVATDNGAKKKAGKAGSGPQGGGGDLSDKLLREVNLNGFKDDVAPLGPLTQRVISGLVEENVLMSENIENKAVQGVGVGRPGFIKNLGLGNAVTLEKRIKKELQEQGIMEADPCSEEEEDEILCELRRCQTELKAASAHNHVQLTRLLRAAREALLRHDLKKKLRDADAKVLEVYRALTAAKQKRRSPSKKDRDAALKALKDREALVRHLDLISNNNNSA